jgi:hypothetical protein
MARTNKSIRSALHKRFKARTGRTPTTDELQAMIDLVDSFTDLCSEMLLRLKALLTPETAPLINPQIAYYRHLKSGLLWIASCAVTMKENRNGADIGVGLSKRRSDKRSVVS